jgi:hypothetical protein
MIRDARGERVGVIDHRPLTYPGSFEIGLAIGDPACWTHGYGTDAALTLITHLFHERNAHRIQMTMGTFNLPMMQAVAKGALTVEGVLRDYFYLDGEYHHAVVCSVLRHEFYRLADDGAYGVLPDAIPRTDKDQALDLLRETLDSLGGAHLTSLTHDVGRRPGRAAVPITHTSEDP